MTSSPINRDHVQSVILDMLTAEQFCGTDDLIDGQVHVVEAGTTDSDTAWVPGGRWFDQPDPYFSMVSVGVGGVITASPELMSWVKPLYEGVDRDQMMEPVRIAEVSSRMAEHGQKTFGPFPRWVCAEEDLREFPAPDGYTIELRDDDDDRHEVMAEQARGRRPGERTTHQFRTVAIGPEGPIGSAGVTADGDGLYQIHIAITEEHRGRGLGRALTSAITRAAFDHGAVPYYGTTSVNTWSMRTAISCGFYPSWVHLFARNVTLP
jgi:GNAT superfamily N-acetyltransferase